MSSSTGDGLVSLTGYFGRYVRRPPQVSSDQPNTTSLEHYCRYASSQRQIPYGSDSVHLLANDGAEIALMVHHSPDADSDACTPGPGKASRYGCPVAVEDMIG